MSERILPRAVRGAVTVPLDSPGAIHVATVELLTALLEANDLALHEITSAIFTATADLRSDVPARAARAVGWHEVPMLCAQEQEVEGGLPRCIRVLLHVAVTADRPLRPAYLRDARVLRPDLEPTGGARAGGAAAR